MCDTDIDSAYSFCCDTDTTPSVFYACPPFNSRSLSLEKTESFCKPPEKIQGLPVELAVRKEPFKDYPIRYIFNEKPKIVTTRGPTSVYKHKTPDPNAVVLDNPVKGPGWTPRFCLKRIYSLLIRDETANQLEEHIWTLWTNYEKSSPDVFVYDNVDILANIVLVLSTSFLRLSYSQSLFDKVMQRLQRGIYMESALKDAIDINRLAYFFTVLGLAIVEGHPIAQASISSILGVWLESVVDKKRRFQTRGSKLAAWRPCPLTSSLMKRSSQLTIMVPDSVLVAALEKSLLPRTIIKYFTDGSHTEGYISILSLLKSCCDVSPVIRDRLLGLPVLDPVLLKLAIVDPTNKILATTNDFVYSYFGINSEPYSKTSSGTDETSDDNYSPILEKDTFQILLTRFVQQLERCESKSLLSTRNDTAFIICLIGERIPAAGQYFEGFVSSAFSLILIVIASIISSGVLGMKDVEMTYLIDSTQDDLELLQYLILMMRCIIEAGCGGDVIEDYSITAVLLRLALGPCQLTSTNNGGNIVIGGEGEKGNDLENAAWTTIQAIATHWPLSLLTPHGAPSLLVFLQAYGKFGDGDQRIFTICMHIIRVLLTTPEEDSCFSDEVLGYFTQLDAMAIFLSILRQVLISDFDTMQENVASNVLYSCAALANHDYSQKEEFVKLEGVSLVIRLMKRLLCHPVEKRHMNPIIQMSLAECISCCVAYYPQALEQFLAMEGIFRLLDLLELSTGPVPPVLLTNCIIQLCDYPRCVNQLLFWNRSLKGKRQRVVFGDELGDLELTSWEAASDGPKCGDILQELRPRQDQTLSSMLCSLWKEEEERFDVLRDPEGCIAS